ncbi:MAG: hypothetical protein ACRDZW_02560, partial [Acidimicrobiales bacterium]
MRLRLVAIAALAGAFVVGLVAGGMLNSPGPAGRRPAPPSVSAEGPRSGPASGSAQERDRTEQGARATAITYATASQDWLYLSDGQVDRSVRAITTASAGPSLARETVAEMRTARDALAKSPGRVWWLVRPLATKVERFDPASARVVVWTVTILSASDVALPQADWARVAVDLVWVDGVWRLQAIDDVPGPTPMTGTKDRP